MLKSYLFGVLSAFLAVVLCLLLFAFVCAGGEDPRALTGLFGVFAFMLGGVSGAIVSALLYKENPMAASLAVSGTYALAVLILSWCNRTDASRPVWQSALLCLCMVGASLAVGAIVSGRMGSAKSARKKLHKRILKR